jgi:hypothetical protein
MDGWRNREVGILVSAKEELHNTVSISVLKILKIKF